MLWGSSALSKFCTSLSKVLTLWHCVKVKQRYHNPFKKTQNSNWNHIFVIIYKVCCSPAQKMLQKSSILTPCHESWWDEGGVAATSPYTPVHPVPHLISPYVWQYEMEHVASISLHRYAETVNLPWLTNYQGHSTCKSITNFPTQKINTCKCNPFAMILLHTYMARSCTDA